MKLKAHPMVAAPRDGEDVMRLGKNGVWRSVDPKRCKPAHAFVCILGQGGGTPRRGESGEAFAIIAVCTCKHCPVTMLALNFACQRDGAASALVRAAVKAKR